MNYAKVPLYVLEAMATLGDETALRELAYRRAQHNIHPAGRDESYYRRWMGAWIKGWMGEPNAWSMGRGGNFAAAWRHAYTLGRQSRAVLVQNQPSDLQNVVDRYRERLDRMPTPEAR